MTIKESSIYAKWFDSLKDVEAKARIDRRIKRASRGDYGDVKPVGENVSELRFHFGPGYRIYFTERLGIIFLNHFLSLGWRHEKDSTRRYKAREAHRGANLRRIQLWKK